MVFQYVTIVLLIIVIISLGRIINIQNKMFKLIRHKATKEVLQLLNEVNK